MGVQGTALGVQKHAQAGQTRTGFGVFTDTGFVARPFRQQVIDAAGPHIDGPLIGVKAIAGVPVKPMQAQAQGHYQNQRQQD